MADISGIIKPNLQALPQIRDRLTFLYLEHCAISRENSAITVSEERGCIYVPSASISVLLLGPGTRITHRGMELIGDSGVTVIWVGEKGVRYYAGGRSLTQRTSLLIRQAALVSNMRSHLQVARQMYQMRFPNEDVSKLTMQQLRGREGARVREIYRQQSAKWQVPWNGRQYTPEDYETGDAVNQALSAGHACLYGLAHAVIVALGCSPGLGFVHVGHECSFVYDIADLYKAETTIPVAFEIAAQNADDIGRSVRQRMRDEMVKLHLLERMTHDIQTLLSAEQEAVEANLVCLWDENGIVPNAISYGKEGKV